MAKLRIGIEACGKSLTVVAVADEQGRILCAERFQSRLNYHEDEKPNLGVGIFDIVREVLLRCGTTPTKFCSSGGNVCAGITGVTTKFDRLIGFDEVWKVAGLAHSTGKLVATGGIEIAFTGTARSLTGAALSSHAGSAAMARTKEKIWRSGGWGSLAGDEGSAYWIGTKTINLLFRLRDERVIPTGATKLCDFVRAALEEFAVWNELIEDYRVLPEYHWIDALILLAERTKKSGEYRYIVSDLAKSIFKLYRQDSSDEYARRIVTEAVNELATQVISAARRAEIGGEEFPLVLHGGVFRYHKFFCDLVGERIKKEMPRARIVLPDDERAMRPVIGALLFALSGSALKLPEKHIIANVEETASSSEFRGVMAND